VKESLVFDAGIISLHLVSDPRVKSYFDDVEDSKKLGRISSVNLSEFHYKTCEKLGKLTADIRYYQIRQTQLKVVETDPELSRMAGVEKCRSQHKLSLADCYALALAKTERATLLTTDRELAKTKEVKTLLFLP